MKTESHGDNSRERDGFDSAVRSREDDHLNRWPLARELYGITVTGPKEWSVRVGLYGEWGTGKTSTLEFVGQMASEHRHIVIWFDPWEHSTKAELWRSFVLTVYKELETKLGKVKGAQKAKVKSWAEKSKQIVSAVTGLANDNAGKALDVGLGLDLVKKHFTFSAADLKSLQSTLGERRVIVLIDDLDRTAPELVPEILFALKELMNIPGFSFVCAFDPVVVGKVLHQYHRGFGDGLKFLEKIIDYPRWLPTPTAQGLTQLALADAARFCPFVPEQAIRDSIPLLPANPRAIRQFIRLMALLKPQIERHYDHELRWPIIVAANVIKVRYPRIAHIVLKGGDFWDGVAMIPFTSKEHNKDEQIAKAVGEYLDRVTAKGISFDLEERQGITAALIRLCSQVSIFAGGAEMLAYQMDVGEAPHAVTWKEFDQFYSEWQRNPRMRTAQAGIAGHAKKVERSEGRVYSELFTATIQSYVKSLDEAETTFAAGEKGPLAKRAELLIGLLECLTFDLGQLDKDERRIGAEELDQVFEKFARLANSIGPTHAGFWPRQEAFLLKLIKEWGDDVTLLLKELCPYHAFSHRYFSEGNANALHRKLCEAVLEKYARQVVSGFRKSEFATRFLPSDSDTEARRMFLDTGGSLWKNNRAPMLSVLEEARTNRIVQENSYQLLQWFDYKLREKQPDHETESIRTLLSDKAVCDALWKAATAIPLGPVAVARIRSLPDSLKTCGCSVQMPPWWDSALASFKVLKPQPEQDEPSPETPPNSSSHSPTA